MLSSCKISLLLLAVVLFSINTIHAIHPLPKEIKAESLYTLSGEDLAFKNTKEIEDILGRKLSIREKISLSFVKKKIKNNPSLNFEQANDQLKIEGFAVAGFVCSLVGFVFAGIILGILGIIFSAIALKKIKNNPETKKGRGLAIAGLVMGIVVLGLTIIGIAILA